jgi:nitrate/nitrite transporter NarK
MLVVAADPVVFFFDLSNTTTLEPLGGLLSDRHGQDEMIGVSLKGVLSFLIKHSFIRCKMEDCLCGAKLQ